LNILKPKTLLSGFVLFILTKPEDKVFIINYDKKLNCFEAGELGDGSVPAEKRKGGGFEEWWRLAKPRPPKSNGDLGRICEAIARSFQRNDPRQASKTN